MTARSGLATYSSPHLGGKRQAVCWHDSEIIIKLLISPASGILLFVSYCSVLKVAP